MKLSDLKSNTDLIIEDMQRDPGFLEDWGHERASESCPSSLLKRPPNLRLADPRYFANYLAAITALSEKITARLKELEASDD